MSAWWVTLGARAKVVLLAGIAGFVVVVIAGGWWALHGEQAALFTDLSPQDAAVITAELEKLKVPYTLADDGSSVLVDASQVHPLRLKLMQKDLPLHGAVGFELFDHSEIGITEFVQKINYQRALQGELARTILSFAEIRDARVHLALPEQSLFRQPSTRPKAAVTLGLRMGQSLRAEQVRGVQRLVAAAVPGMTAQDVTVVDHQGVALSRPADSDPDVEASDARLELKRETENYLSRKAGLVLDAAFGPGQAVASVDVTLDMDRVRVTTEDVLAAPDAKAGGATGVLVRERESTRDGPISDARAADVRGLQGSSTQRDADYQAGRRVEQLVTQPGAVRHVQVVALVRQPLAGTQEEELQRMLGAAVGVIPERGDRVVVHQVTAVAATNAAADDARVQGRARTTPDVARGALVPAWMLVALAISVGLSAALLAGRVLRRRARPLGALGARDRELALEQVRGWLLQSGAKSGAREVSTATGTRP